MSTPSGEEQSNCSLLHTVVQLSKKSPKNQPLDTKVTGGGGGVVGGGVVGASVVVGAGVVEACVVGAGVVGAGVGVVEVAGEGVAVE